MKTMYIPVDEEKVVCTSCDGEGFVNLSCCGDDMRGNDLMICPTCKEHQADNYQVCDECHGSGEVLPCQ